MSNSVRNGIIWVGLSIPQGNKGSRLLTNIQRGEVDKNMIGVNSAYIKAIW